MAMNSSGDSAGGENAALVAAELNAVEEKLQENIKAIESRAVVRTMESVTESRVAQIHTLKTCLELSGKHTRLATRLKDNMMPSTLRAIAVTADTMVPREHAIYDEAFIALVIRVRGLKPQGVRKLFKLPIAISDVALDTSLPNLPVRIQRMMTWANSVEHMQANARDLPDPDEDWLESLSQADAADAAYELSAAVLDYFYPGECQLQIQPGCEAPCSHALDTGCETCSPDTSKERKSCSESSMCSNITDCASRDENEPDHHPDWRTCNHDLEGPFQAISCAPGPLSERHMSPLQSLNSGSTQSPDAAQCRVQPARQADSSSACAPKGKEKCITSEQSGDSNCIEALASVHDGEVTLPEPTDNRMLEASASQGLQDQENNPDTFVLDGSSPASQLGQGASQALPTDNIEAQIEECAIASHQNNSCCNAEDLFPETNFEDSEEDDGGCMEMFKSCMNDHSVYDTKRSQILELSDGPAMNLANDAENSAAHAKRATSRLSGSKTVTEAQKGATAPLSGSQASMKEDGNVHNKDNAPLSLGERNTSCTSATMEGSVSSAAVPCAKKLEAGDMAARLKAKLRTRASASSHVVAARGRKARANRQKAARSSEGHSASCLATKDSSCCNDSVCGDQGSLQGSCTCSSLPAEELCQSAATGVPEQNAEQQTPLVTSSSTEMLGAALSSAAAEPVSDNTHKAHATTDSQPAHSIPQCMPIAKDSNSGCTDSLVSAACPSEMENSAQVAQGAPKPATTFTQEGPMSGAESSTAVNSGPHEVTPGVAEVASPTIAHGLPCSSVPRCVEGAPDAAEVPLSGAAEIPLFPSAETFSCAAGSILTSVVANYVITSIPELMYTVCGQLTYDQVAQMLPSLACSSGLVAVLSGDPPTIADGRAAPFLWEICQKRYPAMKIPPDLSAAIEQDTLHARVILRHVLKVSEQGEKCRKEEELAAKQANKGKKKSSKKMKLKKFAEELDVQAIMLDLFQELLPQDCRLPMTMDQVHQLPMVKELLGSLPPVHSDHHTASTPLSMPQSVPPVNETASSEPTLPSVAMPVSPQPPSGNALEQEDEVEEVVNQKVDASEACTSKVAASPKPCGLRKLPPRSKRAAETNIASLATPSSANATEAQSSQAQPAAKDPAQAQPPVDPTDLHLQAVYGLTRMCCMRVDELIATWPPKFWCQVPSAWQIQAVLQALAAVMGKSNAPESKALAQAAVDAASKCGLTDEALIYTLSTLSGPGCHQACHELIWNHDGRFRACALRLPAPNFTQAGASPASVNSWMLPQVRPDIAECMGKPMVHEMPGAEASNAGATFMEPPPRDFGIEHPKMQAWADSVAADIVSRRTKDCDAVKATLSQIIEHLGLEGFLEVSMKSRPDEQFKQGNMEVAMLHHRYSTEAVDVPPQQSWCMTLGGLDSLQVCYQPRASDGRLKCPCIPFECSGVDEAVKEHLGRCTIQGAAEEVAAHMQDGGPASSILALSAAAAGPGNCARRISSTAKAKSSNAAQQQPAPGMFSKVWREVSKPLMGSGSKPKEPEPNGADAQTSDSSVLASADANSAPRVRVEGDVLAGAVDMDADALAGAAGLHKQCRMM